MTTKNSEKNVQQEKSKVYNGLLFIENLKNVKESSASEFFITYEGFWNECHESTNYAVDFTFNYLKVSNSIFYKHEEN